MSRTKGTGENWQTAAKRTQTSLRRQTRLSGASFRGAVLHGAKLEGVDLRTAIGLTRDQLACALTDESTLLPESLEEYDQDT